MLIREATTEDWPAIWPFFHRIVADGETFTYPPGLDEADGRDYWLMKAPNRTVVAVDDSRRGPGYGQDEPEPHG